MLPRHWVRSARPLLAGPRHPGARLVAAWSRPRNKRLPGPWAGRAGEPTLREGRDTGRGHRARLAGKKGPHATQLTRRDMGRRRSQAAPRSRGPDPGARATALPRGAEQRRPHAWCLSHTGCAHGSPRGTHTGAAWQGQEGGGACWAQKPGVHAPCSWLRTRVGLVHRPRETGRPQSNCEHSGRGPLGVRLRPGLLSLSRAHRTADP